VFTISPGVLLFMFVAQFAALVYVSLVGPTTPGRLDADASILSCGGVPCRHEGEFSFTLTNTGGEVCVLDSVSTSCGCVAPKVYGEVQVAPGAKLSVPVGLTARNPGTFSVSVVVHYRNQKGQNLATEVLLSGTSECDAAVDADLGVVVPAPDSRFM
jgi:hypothetical protein